MLEPDRPDWMSLQADDKWEGVDLQAGKAHPARVYDYLLGGKDNFEADREVAEKQVAAYPEVRQALRDNREFLVRVVSVLAEAGIDQFIDLGSGFPTSPNVHEVARAHQPAARVVYVDNDPVVVAHNRALRETGNGVVTIEGDARDAVAVLADPALQRLIDFTRPVAVLFLAIFHFIPDTYDPERIVATFADRMAPGSHLAISTATSEGLTDEERRHMEAAFDEATAPFVFRTREQIERLFIGFELLDPGLVPLAHWRADGPGTRGKGLGAVGRKL